MSMNLYCNKLNLVQTPTKITYLIMTFDDGKIYFKVRGQKAKGALERYCRWLETLVPEEIADNDLVRYEKMKVLVDIRIKEVEKLLKTENLEDIEVYIS
ncbi:MAG: hypothetical protein KatS3mg002_0413 [Candidatus Woesearchaeota archaeon]|nr:MAG: hypothetical protein KatS3mg002_0413 [Candidatus Woesearchaeota archaeon]